MSGTMNEQHIVDVESQHYSHPAHLVGNDDPAMEIAHQHQHPHIHHVGAAVPDAKHSAVYTTGTTLDHSAIPDQNTQYRRSHDNKQFQTEKTAVHSSDSEGESDVKKVGWLKSIYIRFRPVVHFFIWAFFTGWWAAGLALHKNVNWLIPFLFWLCITLRIFFFYVPSTIISKPLKLIWDNTALRVVHVIPEKMRVWLAAAGVIAVFIVGSFASKTSPGNGIKERAVSLFGLVVFGVILYGTSKHRHLIVWHTVIVGMLFQFIIALFVLRTGAGYDIFNFIASLAVDLLGFAGDGLAFLTSADVVANYHYFFFSVLPAIIFFVSFVQLLFYWGILQWLIGKFAVFFFWAMRVSGSEAVVASASPFVGQGESAILIKPFIPHMTKAEIHQIMCSGFATIAGSVLVAYISMGVNPQALISSCVMSIPASLAVSKMRWPETEESLTAGRIVIPDDDSHRAANAMHAFAEGAWLGLKIAGMIMATLLCIISLLALANGLLGWWGRYINIPNLTIELIVGYICFPIAFLLGVPWHNTVNPVERDGHQLLLVGELIGIKLISNEFVAYNSLSTDTRFDALLPRSRLIATYALCGFANIGSLGNQIGVLSQIAPSRSGDVARIAFSALITGAISTFSSANVAGMLVEDPAKFYQSTTTSSSK